MSPTSQSAEVKIEGEGIVLPSRPTILELNVRLWLRELSRLYGHHIDLSNVPTDVWDYFAGFRFDAVWLMGVWERSPAGLAFALQNDTLCQAFDAALPNAEPEDIVGSPYCVRRYEADSIIGGREGLAAARAELARRGMALILDFVPNHVAPDHPWIADHPEYFIRGTAEDLVAAPSEFFEAGDEIIAHGRDPYYPPWPDVAQLNGFDPGLRAATLDLLRDIADQCDGLRCDMAMLMTNEIFTRTWGDRAGLSPAEEYWHEIIPAIRESHPHFCFIGEVYWNMEWEMMKQGFDFCYDKRLYDRLAHETAAEVRGHLAADVEYQDKLVRFIENHDEPRAAQVFVGGRALAAAIAVYTLPGAKLFHQGQFEGATVRLPVFLTRRPEEPVDRALHAFYRRLANEIQTPALREGQWRLCASTGWPDNRSFRNLVAWCWRAGDERRIVVVNLSPYTSDARVQLPWPDLAGQNWVFVDVMDDTTYEWNGDEVLNMGLYVSLAPWGRHFFAVR